MYVYIYTPMYIKAIFVENLQSSRLATLAKHGPGGCMENDLRRMKYNTIQYRGKHICMHLYNK